MLLFRTTCLTDFKARPSHTLELIAKGIQEELIRAMDRDVCLWQAEELATEECDEYEKEERQRFQDAGSPLLAVRIQARIEELVKDPKLPELWKHRDRFEMQREPEQLHREFVERMDSDRSTVAYHFLELGI